MPTMGRAGSATRWTAAGLAGTVVGAAELAAAGVDATPVERVPPVEVACATEAGTAASAAQQAAAMVKRPGGARI